MKSSLRQFQKGLAVMLCAWLSLLLWAAAASIAAASPGGQIALSSGGQMSWSVSEAAPVKVLAVAAPSTIEWSPGDRTGPVHIPANANYAAFIERWEFALWRQGDEGRRHPVLIRRGTAAELEAGIDWDGRVQSGPPLRPGESLIAVLRVRDIAGNTDETEPQTMLVARYLMPGEQKRLDRETRNRRALLTQPSPLALDAIPVRGREVTVRVFGSQESTAFYLSDMAMREEDTNRWTVTQILPAGTHVLKAQVARPILGGTRLVSAGRATVTVPGADALLVAVRGTGQLAREPSPHRLDGMKPDGMISGRDAARLRLWDQDSAEARLALALTDPKRPVPLHRDARSRSVAELEPAPRSVPWGTSHGRSGPRHLTVERRARYTVLPHVTMTLPHTDVEPQPFRLMLRSGGTQITYLLPGKHYMLDAEQGRLRVSDTGRKAMFEALEKAPDVTVEAVYRVRQSLAGLTQPGSANDTVEIDGSGETLANIYGDAFPEVGGSAVLSANGGDGRGWFARNFGWLTGG